MLKCLQRFLGGISHVVTCVLAMVLFFNGFLPSKTTIGNELEEGIEKYTHYINQHHDTNEKVVLMVIDALRADFLASHSLSINWPHLSSVLEDGRARILNGKVHPPTVTLPRIKAMMSGDIPGFIDVIKNFDTTELVTDNILHKMKALGKTAVFYGDDTWLKLFPDIFTRSEGTTSFFVSDYEEVDNNVTRHLVAELEKLDWDILILHYLGLDHIGHLIGPMSDLVPGKLQEMDGVVGQIHKALKNLTSEFMFIVCGDHGMADKGGHGGVTPSETNIPMVFISNQNMHKPLNELHTDVYQIDLVPTLASYIGVDIPSSNLGVALPQVLLHVKGSKYTLDALVKNSKQLERILQSVNTRQAMDLIERLHRLDQTYDQMDIQLPERTQKLILDYYNLNSDIRQLLAERIVDYDFMSMCVGFLLILLVSMCFVVDHTFSLWTLSLCGVFLPLIVSLYQTVCTSTTYRSKELCQTYQGYAATGLLAVYLSRVLTVVLSYNTTMLNLMKQARGSIHTIEGTLCLMFPLLHSVSLLASSFIEEEHQLVYFFSTSLVLLLFIRSVISDLFSKDSQHGRMSTCSKSIKAGTALVLMTLARKWNQTGDKWAHLLDISDILNRQALHRLKLGLSLASVPVCLFITYPKSDSWLVKLVTMLSTLSLTTFILNETTDVTSIAIFRRIIEGHTVYYSVLLLVLLSIWYGRISQSQCFETLRLSWTILILLLYKSVNLPLLTLVISLEMLISGVVTAFKTSSRFGVYMLYYWLGMACYFYQGNSNSLSTVDVGAGYKGLLSYDPFVTGLLMLCNTYAAPIYWILCLLTRLSYSNQFRVLKAETNSLDGRRWVVVEVLWLFLLLRVVTAEHPYEAQPLFELFELFED